MELGHVRRIAVGAGACVWLGVLATVVGGAPVLGTGNFSLPGTQSMPLWAGETPSPNPKPRVAMSVTGTNGSANVYGFDTFPGCYPAAAQGVVKQDFTLILEGAFDIVRAKANGGVAGSFQVRQPTDGTDIGPDWTVGSGSAALTLPQTYAFYGAMSPYPRLVRVDAGDAAVSVTNGNPANDVLADVDAHDSTLCIATARAFGLKKTVADPSTANYVVSNLVPASACGPFEATAAAQLDGDVDEAYADGSLDLTVTFTMTPATPASTVTVNYETPLGPAPPLVLTGTDPTKTVTGLLVNKVTWRYSEKDTKLKLTMYAN